MNGKSAPMAAPSVSERARSIAFAVAFYGVTVLMAFPIPLLLLFPQGAIKFWCEVWSGAQRWCLRWVMGVRVVVEGEWPAGPVLVACKHEAMFEAVDMPTLLDFPAIFAKVELLNMPFWGKAGRAYGLVPVERDQGAKALRAMVSAARSFSASGRPLVIFPEGTRVTHGTRPELQAGFAGLYKLIGYPVVPLAVDSGRLLRGFWKRRGVVTYRFGAPIEPGLPREVIEARVHAAINALNTKD
ncbi:1-acyl-sn-glycerol-3-phosphate acyltransferase [Novosphingobium sp. FSY-8]|uniref:1-acyl-sn-glycerol-3-phosphate acyltransferase n=1 Tax=Novosphingobium ovatum TaxID=1908523 RepID=A0ABW9XDQ9_9SPHN|nr:lysophospholipid acyltransferase family protein [Novosphingobium ovatum]NBC36681.1 1-acyl-sn-glycerol-3-phosphate acyltransferase [Novosphingobium ovatum]